MKLLIWSGLYYLNGFVTNHQLATKIKIRKKKGELIQGFKYVVFKYYLNLDSIIVKNLKINNCTQKEDVFKEMGLTMDKNYVMFEEDGESYPEIDIAMIFDESIHPIGVVEKK